MSIELSIGHDATSAHSREYLSPHQFAALTGLSIATVRRYVAGGVIQSIQPAGKRGRVLIPRSQLQVGPAAHAAAQLPPGESTVPPQSPRQRPSGPPPRWTRRK